MPMPMPMMYATSDCDREAAKKQDEREDARDDRPRRGSRCSAARLAPLFVAGFVIALRTDGERAHRER